MYNDIKLYSWNSLYYFLKMYMRNWELCLFCITDDAYVSNRAVARFLSWGVQLAEQSVAGPQ
jgi:hypothetical protein